MLNTKRKESCFQGASNFEHSQSTTDKEAQKSALPPDAILLSVLKTLEIQLQAKGLVRRLEFAFNPLWFLAETERNAFLWRNGCSLIQKDSFEFWVDIEALVQKRLSQLKSLDNENPFKNPTWGCAPIDPRAADAEIEYLTALSEATKRLSSHTHALSQVGSKLLDEYERDHATRQLVVLPAAGAKEGVQIQ